MCDSFKLLTVTSGIKCIFRWKTHFFPRVWVSNSDRTNDEQQKQTHDGTDSILFFYLFVICSHSRWSSSFASITHSIAHTHIIHRILIHSLSFSLTLWQTVAVYVILISRCGFSLVYRPIQAHLQQYIHREIFRAKQWNALHFMGLLCVYFSSSYFDMRKKKYSTSQHISYLFLDVSVRYGQFCIQWDGNGEIIIVKYDDDGETTETERQWEKIVNEIASILKAPLSKSADGYCLASIFFSCLENQKSNFPPRYSIKRPLSRERARTHTYIHMTLCSQQRPISFSQPKKKTTSKIVSCVLSEIAQWLSFIHAFHHSTISNYTRLRLQRTEDAIRIFYLILLIFILSFTDVCKHMCVWSMFAAHNIV